MEHFDDITATATCSCLVVSYQMTKGQQLAVEYANTEAMKRVEELRRQLKQEYNDALAQAREEWEQDMQKQLNATKEATRKLVVRLC
jgi:23S rRNA C2498 (ribose-2'-O)-methylase RlmM